ncbi:MAG: YebC/PmpR family DNA-binding transcriptional regulator [Puniceicoccales bacterium]|jgi:YebC/PmpR family DNA-binding regulatory protein|nr:YebC/PmpR family DNA-binding transcriptional regulator [Puniceicoccales bacterium]
MSGHSKWATTKHHKAVVDARRGKLFSILSKEITLAVRSGGKDPEFNPRLRTMIFKAKTANMPADNIKKAIQKGTGEIPGVIIEELLYEGYAPGGVGVIVEATTDNKNRTTSEVRSVFTKWGGNLAGAGALAFNFQRLGQFLVDKSKISEDHLIEIALAAGAEDVKSEEEFFEVLCPMSVYDEVVQAFQKVDVETTSSEIVYYPNNLIPVQDKETAQKIFRLLGRLEELEDVKNVYMNGDVPDEWAEEESEP